MFNADEYKFLLNRNIFCCIKGLKLQCFGTYFGYIQGAVVDEVPQQTRVDISSTVWHLFYFGTLQLQLYIAAAVDKPHQMRDSLSPSSTAARLHWAQQLYISPQQTSCCGAAAALQLAVVSKIQLAQGPQFESFYTVPHFCLRMQ